MNIIVCVSIFGMVMLGTATPFGSFGIKIHKKPISVDWEYIKVSSSDNALNESNGNVSSISTSYPTHTFEKILDGERAEMKEVPWMVYLRSAKSKFPRCGGSIIDKFWILTAGHCVCKYNGNGRNPIVDRVATGHKQYRHANAIYLIENVICHPKFKVRKVKKGSGAARIPDNDIALIKLKKPIKLGSKLKSISICNSSVRMIENKLAIVSGWGRIVPSGTYNDGFLRKAEMEVMPMRKCRNTWRFNGYGEKLGDSRLCLKTKRGNPRNGDSGGPATVQGVQIGIVSFGIGSPSSVGVYTNVYYFRHWIKSYVKNVKFQEIKP